MNGDREVAGCGSESAERVQRTALLGVAERGGEYRSTDTDSSSGNGSGTMLPPPVGVAKPRPFPFGPVLILAMCMTLNIYTLVNLFPCAGMMVKGLLGDDDFDNREGLSTRTTTAFPKTRRCSPVGFCAESAKKMMDGSSTGGSDTSVDSVDATDELSASEETEEEEREPGLLGSDGLLATPHHGGTRKCSTSCLQTLAIGFDEVYPLFALSTPNVGGLGWSPLQIGKVLVSTGVLMAFCQVFVFPPSIKMVGIMTWQRLGCGVGVFAFVAVPAVKTFSWDYNSLFIASVLVNAISTFCIEAVNLALAIGSTTRCLPTCGGSSVGFTIRPRASADAWAPPTDSTVDLVV
eukprot:g10363.t1